MVWDALENTNFMNQSALRAVHVNSVIESIYQLAPIYWGNAGDIAIGAGDRAYRTLAAPIGENLYLVNDRGVTDLPVWKSLNDILLLEDDLDSNLLGSTFVQSSVIIKRPYRIIDTDYRKTADSWVQIGTEDDEYEFPVVVVNNSPAGNNVMQLRYDENDERVRLFCTSTSRFTMLAAQQDSTNNAFSLRDFFPRNSDVIGLNSQSNAQVRTFEVQGTGLLEDSVGFDFIDSSSFVRNDFFGDALQYLFIMLFYRY